MCLNTIYAFANVPALSARTLRRDIQHSGFTTGPEIEVMHPKAVLWYYVQCMFTSMSSFSLLFHPRLKYLRRLLLQALIHGGG